MTDATIRTALASAVADVLESMFFLGGLNEAAEPPAEAEAVMVHLRFEGDPPGCFLMRLAHSAANSIAADFLGEDAGALTARQSIDVTLELANMICGAVLSRIESSVSFRLCGPQISAGCTGQHLPDANNRYTVETGSGTLTVAIRMGTPTCSSAVRFAS